MPPKAQNQAEIDADPPSPKAHFCGTQKFASGSPSNSPQQKAAKAEGDS